MSEAGTPHIGRTNSRVTRADRWKHFLIRWGYRRNAHRVEPGLYALGNPGPEARVFVTANYTLSFDALRSVLTGEDAYILVLNTEGINVWCAAGEGTFGTDELVARIEATSLGDVVTHRKLLLPQLGAPGVSAHEVKERSGFKVEYGPVRALDLPEYLRTRKAAPEMRKVRFGLLDRVILIPVELVHVLLPMFIAAVVLYFAGGPLASSAAVAAVLAGAVLFPALLPWLPTKEFSTKGFILGGAVAIPFALAALLGGASESITSRLAPALSYILAMPPVTAFLALNFTGATTFTSRSGVKREISSYVPGMAWMFGCGVVLAAASTLIRFF
ncbi:mercury methylation corrinoid protein HgcA [Thermodesulfobacteriota bacterium]